MARKSQHTFAKRQREQKKAEKARQKQARREDRLSSSETAEREGEGGVVPVAEGDGIGEKTDAETASAGEQPGDSSPDGDTKPPDPPANDVAS